MGFNDLMYKVKQWDNRAAQWMGRHFYIILFEAILAIIFILAFITALKLLNTSFNIQSGDITDQLILIQSIFTIFIVMLLLLISLGVLNLINSNTRHRSILKNIEFNLTKRRTDQKPHED